MTERKGLEVSVALGEVVRLANVDVIAAYPITPQTHIVEHLAEIVADGELEASFIPVESEHSALSACLGASAVGARAFTATAGQGLELMHEVVYVAASMQLPLVMAVANRALSAPLSVWGDHSDVMSVRDTGWIQIFTRNGQEVVDNILCAYRIAEDNEVLLPVMVHLDGFHLTHVIEPVLLPGEDEVARFLPPYHYPYPLDPRAPVSMGCFAPPVMYMEAKRVHEEHLRTSIKVIERVWKDFGDSFGRYYQCVESYRTEGAETVLVTLGSFSETASLAVDMMRDNGINVGLVSIRLWRPFPFAQLREVLSGVNTVIVLDRALSPGGPGGPVAAEIKAALYDEYPRPRVVGVVSGLGGRDITVEGFREIVERGMTIASSPLRQESIILGVRGDE